MRSKVELTDSLCKVSEKGDFSFTPTARQFAPLWLSGLALLALGVVLQEALTTAAILLPAVILACSVRWVSQPKTFLSPSSNMIVWSRGFRRLRLPCKTVSSVNVFLDRREYAWSTHLVDRRKNIVEMNARLELVLEDRHLSIGSISGQNAEERALSLAQSIAHALGVPVSNTGYISRYL